MNCTGDTTAERLSAQCFGHVEGQPVEVQTFRSYRPHNRLCYGLSFTQCSLNAQIKACFSSNGQREFSANVSHSSVLLRKHMGIPAKTALRLLLRPGPRRWALGIELLLGLWRTNLNLGLRSETDGLYGCHGLLEYGVHSVTHRAEVIGRMRVGKCIIWTDATVVWDSVSSSLWMSVRCTGLGKMVWVQVSDTDGGAPHKTSLSLHGQLQKSGLKGSLEIENQQDSLQCLLSVLLKKQRAEVNLTLQHHWSSLTSAVPKTVDVRASCQQNDTLQYVRAQASVNNSNAQLEMSAAWQPSPSFSAVLKQNLTSAGLPRGLTVGMSAVGSRAKFEVESDVCSVLFLAKLHKRGRHGGGAAGSRSDLIVLAQQRCGLLKVRMETSKCR